MQYIIALIFSGAALVTGGLYLEHHPPTAEPTPATEQGIVAPIEKNSATPQPSPEPAKTVKLVKPSVPTSQPVTKPIEKSEKNDNADELQTHIDEMLQESKDNTKRLEKEQKERDAYYANLAEQQKTALVQARLVAQQKADAAAAVAQKKRDQCRKDLQACMNDIGGQIMQFNGSAYNVMARKLGSECVSKYRCN